MPIGTAQSISALVARTPGPPTAINAMITDTAPSTSVLVACIPAPPSDINAALVDEVTAATAPLTPVFVAVMPAPLREIADILVDEKVGTAGTASSTAVSVACTSDTPIEITPSPPPLLSASVPGLGVGFTYPSPTSPGPSPQPPTSRASTPTPPSMPAVLPLGSGTPFDLTDALKWRVVVNLVVRLPTNVVRGVHITLHTMTQLCLKAGKRGLCMGTACSGTDVAVSMLKDFLSRTSHVTLLCLNLSSVLTLPTFTHQTQSMILFMLTLCNAVCCLFPS
jgi:hypothetical protein